MLRLILEEKNLSLYRLEKLSHISHATLSDIYNEKTSPEKCSSGLIYALSQSLDMSMDELYNYLTYKDLSLFSFNKSFDLYKSNICHELKHVGSKEFLKKYLSKNEVRVLYNNKKKLEALYLLSMIDYLLEKNDLPLVKQYDDLRLMKLNKIYVPESIYRLLQTNQIKVSEIYKESIDEFLKHNIVESEISNVY